MKAHFSDNCSSAFRQSGERPSPFKRIIALDWYDGPVSGIATCDSDIAYGFSLLAWNDKGDSRIFWTARLEGNSFSNTCKLLATETEPTWPIWVPIRKADVSPALKAAGRKVRSHLSRSIICPAFVFLTQSIEANILASREINPEELNLCKVHPFHQIADRGETEVQKWLSFLDVS